MHVGGGADEGEGDEVDAELERELEVVDVLARQRRDRDRHARQVDALVRADPAADDDAAARPALLDPVDPQTDEPVVDQDVVTGLEHVADHGRQDGQIAVRRRSLADDGDLVAPVQDHRLGQVADAQLGPLEVRDQRERPADLLGDRAHGARPLRVLFVRAVGQVEARRVHPGGRELAQPFARRRRGTERGDDLGAPRGSARHGLRVATAVAVVRIGRDVSRAGRAGTRPSRDRPRRRRAPPRSGAAGCTSRRGPTAPARPS